MARDTNTDGDERGDGWDGAGRPPARSAEWYAAEVPSILAGLEASGAVSGATAASARRLVAEGAYRRALAVALDEAF